MSDFIMILIPFWHKCAAVLALDGNSGRRDNAMRHVPLEQAQKFITEILKNLSKNVFVKNIEV